MANILTCYYRPKPGGLCKRLFRAINALLSEGHNVHYLAVTSFPIDHPNCNFHKFPWPAKKSEGFLFWSIFHLIAPIILIFIGYKHHISHIFTFANTYSLVMQPLRIMKQIPSVLFLRADSIKNHELKERPQWLLKLELCFEGLAIANIRLYGVSDSLTSSVIKRHSFFSPSLSGTLRNDTKKRTSRLIKNYNSPLRLACVGILEPRKNQQMLLNVMKMLDPTETHLYLYGIGPDMEKLKQKIHDKELGHVHIMGWIPAEEIWSQIDLLLIPSLHEGAPNAILEAISQGIPVLASDIQEHKEILPPQCLLPIDNYLKWVACLKRIIADPVQELEALRRLEHPYYDRLCFNWDQKICDYILGIQNGY